MLPSNSSEAMPPAENHEDLGPLVIGVSSMMMVLTALCVGLRFWVRAQRSVKPGADDILIVLASVFLCGYYTLILLQVKQGGLGKTVLDSMMEDPENLPRMLKMLFAIELVAPFVITFVKLSILAMYWRIFPTRFMKISCVAIGAIQSIWNVGYVLGALLQCTPISKSWDPTLTTGTCNSGLSAWLGWAATIPEFATDLVIIALPIYETSRLHTSLASKIAISSTFAVGVFAIVSSIIRLVLSYRYTLWTTGDSANEFAVHVAYVQLWCFIEGTMGMMCACLPTLRPLLNIFTKKGSWSSAISGKTPPPQFSSKGTQGSKNANNSSPRTRGSFERLPDMENSNKSWLSETDPEPWSVLRQSPSGSYGDQVPLKAITVTQRAKVIGEVEEWPMPPVRGQTSRE